jgi:hypothetical protein
VDAERRNKLVSPRKTGQSAPSILLLLLLLLFTAIGLSPGGSSPTLVQTKIKIHKTTITTKQVQNNNNRKLQNTSCHLPNYKLTAAVVP